MKDTKAAFLWIINILKQQGIKYKISGGLAARIYGSNRELADIDIDVAPTDILKISQIVKPYIIYGPAIYQDSNWDLELTTLSYQGQEIDIASTDSKIFNRNSGQWEKYPSDLNSRVIMEVYGEQVPVETRDSLIEYKSKLAREVDLEDIKQLKNI